MLQLPPLSLYIHIPWCIRKCPYCDFNSHQAGTELPGAGVYSGTAGRSGPRPDLGTGPGNSQYFLWRRHPSLFSAAACQALFNGLQQRLGFAADIEITLEANPGTFEAEKFAAYRQLGINRLSIGIQSFNPQHLQALGRVHDSAQAMRAVELAKQAGFDNFNLDLMYGLPGQTVAQALADIEQALAFNPPHLSWYQLTIEPNTEFYKTPPQLPQDDDLWDIQEAGLALLQQHGFEHYEISAHAQPGKAARHNLNYWQFGDYLGIGAGAHGKITLPQTGQIIRTENPLTERLSESG